MKNSQSAFRILFVLSLSVIGCTNPTGQSSDSKATTGDLEKDNAYDDFLQRVKENESYIGYFAAEEKYISEQTADYLEARKKCFLGISISEEEPFEYLEPFTQFCKDKGLLKSEDEEEWEKVLTILSFELYPNKPIFEFSTDKTIAHRSMEYSSYPNKKLALDLFIPKEPLNEPMPVVVCIHGGGWVVNRRIWFEPFAQYLASNGIAAVTIDYRKLPAVGIMDIIYDSKAAVRWVRANAEKYNLDPNRIGAIGASAGAHLVSLLGTSADKPALEGNGGNPGVSSAVQAVVGIATPGFTPGTTGNRAKRFGLSAEEVQMISPYENISEASAPLFLIHGTVDQTVPPLSSQEMYDRYQEVGAHVELEWIPDEGHGFYEGTDIGIRMATKFFTEQFNTKE